MLANQQIILVPEQVDILWQMAHLGCEHKLPSLCITSVQFENFTRAANLSKALSCYLLQNWTIEFEQTLWELRIAILQVNSTHLDLSLTEGLSTWISAAFSYFMEWVGVGLFGVAV
jgi:MAD (mothers against decapentaplegic) family protein 1